MPDLYWQLRDMEREKRELGKTLSCLLLIRDAVRDSRHSASHNSTNPELRAAVETIESIDTEARAALKCLTEAQTANKSAQAELRGLLYGASHPAARARAHGSDLRGGAQ